MAGFYNRENRVPYFQRMFFEAEKKHVRQWNATPRAKMLLYPYYVMLAGTSLGCTYMMCRMVLGHKTWFGKD